MSYDLYILPPQPGLTAETVYEAMESIDEGLESPFGEPTNSLNQCAQEIWSQFPPLSELDDEGIDQSIWSGDHDTIDGYMYLNMALSTDESILDQITSIAQRHGLAVLDPQTDTFRTQFPSGFQDRPSQSIMQKLIGLFSK